MTGDLVEVADGVHAYLQRGGWGFSNAGIVSAHRGSLLVDTLYDLRSTAAMLDSMRRTIPAARRIETVVNTHANGDHCWGNQLVDGAQIISSRLAAEEMRELPPQKMRALLGAARFIRDSGPRTRRVLDLLAKLGVPKLGPMVEAAEFALECFGAFDFRGIRLTLPTRTFDGQLNLQLEEHSVELIQVGPAHTKGDLLVHLPKRRVVFTGDILFIGSHPIAWQGPIRNWIAACDRLLDLEVDVVVPGHGPLTSKDGVRETKAYWERIVSAAERGQRAGVSADEAARSLLAEGFGERTEAHRVVANVDAAYRELRGDASPPDPVEMMARMARLEAS